jgi:hypothetical protein
MTTKLTWTEEEYEAAGKKSIHLRLVEEAYDALSWLSYRLDEGRARLVERLIFDEEERVKNRKA